MVQTRSQSKVAKGCKKPDDSDEDVQLLCPASTMGRGCRERRATEFFVSAPEVPTRRRVKAVQDDSDGDDDGDDDDEEVERAGRKPQREAAKNAINRIRETLSSDERRYDDPPTTSRPRRAPKHQGEASSVDVSSAEEDSDDGNSSESSDADGGLIDQRAAVNLEQAYAKNKRKPINSFVDHLFGKADRKRPRDGSAHRHSARRPGDRGGGGGGGGDADDGEEDPRDSLGDITPLPVDPSVSLDSVGGLPNHAIALREMVILPLLYPQLLQRFHITPPRGVLFVGPPGTGKTLMARALANEGMANGQRPITFFVRKGADILSKWVGESEKQLRILFDEARRRAPSIIFFDEIDGLAPVRHSKQEQSHACLVSTLLALMDGIDSRGQVIVIGATNRPDTIDPALRRPGRFDREMYFPLPDVAARRHIIAIHTHDRLKGNVDKKAIEDELLRCSEGWSGADIAAVCTEASLHALRSSLPQIFVTSHRLVLPLVEELQLGLTNFKAAIRQLQPALFRSASSNLVAPQLDEHLEALCAEEKRALVEFVSRQFEPAASAMKDLERRCDDNSAAMRQLLTVPLPTVQRSALVCLTCPAVGVAKLFASVLTKAFPSFFCRTVHVPVLFSALAQTEHGGEHSAPETIVTVVESVMATSPSVLLLLGLDEWLASHSGGDAPHAVGHLLYSLGRLDEHNTLIVCPVGEKSPWLGIVEKSRLASVVGGGGGGGGGARRPHAAWVKAINPYPSADARKVFFRRLHDTVATCIDLSRTPKQWPALTVDTTPLPQAQLPQGLPASTVNWERLEYKRRQLRHMLKKFLLQFINKPAFSMLLSPDLDLTEAKDGSLLKRWRKHTHGKRLGLSDIMEKLENEEYVSLTQYHDDIEQLVSNVRTFFSTYSKEDQRYRNRAAEVKDTTVLNMYKINKRVVQFCEQHAALVDEPSSSASSVAPEATGRGGGPLAAVDGASPEVKQPRSGTAEAAQATPVRQRTSASSRQSSAKGEQPSVASSGRTASSSSFSAAASAAATEDDTTRRPDRSGGAKPTEVPAAVVADSARLTYEGLRLVMIAVLNQAQDALRCTKGAAPDVWKMIAASTAELGKKS